MERAVYKRESIQLKYDNKGKEKKEMVASKSGSNGAKRKNGEFFNLSLIRLHTSEETNFAVETNS